MAPFRYIVSCITLLLAITLFPSCSKDEEDVRMPEDIVGVWMPQDNENLYYEFCDDNSIRKLDIEYQDGESIGIWDTEVYYYEPGYNLVIYLTAHQEGIVYEIVSLSDSQLVWCPVDKIDVIDRDESIGKIIGDIIKKAQEGFTLDPELYVTFKKIPRNQFLEMLEDLDIMYPWMFD